jgi:hypothetical protein
MRSAASCGHPLQVIVAPRGALTWRLIVLIVLSYSAPRRSSPTSRRARDRSLAPTRRAVVVWIPRSRALKEAI